MLELIKACLIVNLIVLAILIGWVIVMGIWHFKKDKKHQEEKAKLEESRDYHIKELQKRSESENVDLH